MSALPPERSPGRVATGWRLLRLGLAAVFTSLPLGLLSLALALLIWVSVTNEENPSTRRTLIQEIAVEQVNIPRNLLPTDMTPARVSVTVTGPRNAVNEVRPEDVSVRVDLSRADEELNGAREGTVERPLHTEVRRRGVRAETSPEEVKVRLEQEVRRQVPVCVDKVDVPPPGFVLDEPIVTDPAQVTVTGPKRNIDVVDCATATLRLTGLTVNVQGQVALEPRDAAGRVVGGVNIQPPTARMDARVRQELYPRQVTVDVRLSGRPAPGYTIASVRTDPTLATVVGPLTAVQGLTSVPTEVIDIEGARTDIVRAVTLQIPPGVSSGDRLAVVTITLQAARTSGSLGAVPRIVNLAPGLTATLTTPAVAVLVSGATPDVVALKPAEVAVVVDAVGLGPGTYRLEPRATVPQGITLDGVSPDRVEVVIVAASR